MWYPAIGGGSVEAAELLLEYGTPVDQESLGNTGLHWAALRGHLDLTRFLAGQQPGPESSVGKLRWSHYHREITEAAVDMSGPEATVSMGTETRSGLGAPDIGTANTPNAPPKPPLAMPNSNTAGIAAA